MIAHHAVRPALRPDRGSQRAAVDASTCSGPTGSAATSSPASSPARADILLVAPLATLLGDRRRDALGLITGYFRGIADDTISRVIDAVLAIPLIVLAVTVVAALGSRSNWTVIDRDRGRLHARSSPARSAPPCSARRELDYVEAARLRGERAPYVMFAEVLPNVMPPILVEATVRLGYAIFAVATLTFIGFGLQPPSPDWAVQIADNYPLPRPASGGRCSSPRSRSRRSSSPSTWSSDSLQQVLER